MIFYSFSIYLEPNILPPNCVYEIILQVSDGDKVDVKTCNNTLESGNSKMCSGHNFKWFLKKYFLNPDISYMASKYIEKSMCFF